MKLGELADVVRSKNAGIYYITIDVMFKDRSTYEAVKRSGVISTEQVAPRYNRAPEEINIYEYDPGLAFKITIPRRVTTGSHGDSDLFGAQQHAPMLSLDVPVEDIDG